MVVKISSANPDQYWLLLWRRVTMPSFASVQDHPETRATCVIQFR
jgi:hypothetical protein